MRAGARGGLQRSQRSRDVGQRVCRSEVRTGMRVCLGMAAEQTEQTGVGSRCSRRSDATAARGSLCALGRSQAYSLQMRATLLGQKHCIAFWGPHPSRPYRAVVLRAFGVARDTSRSSHAQWPATRGHILGPSRLVCTNANSARHARAGQDQAAATCSTATPPGSSSAPASQSDVMSQNKSA